MVNTNKIRTKKKKKTIIANIPSTAYYFASISIDPLLSIWIENLNNESRVLDISSIKYRYLYEHTR